MLIRKTSGFLAMAAIFCLVLGPGCSKDDDDSTGTGTGDTKTQETRCYDGLDDDKDGDIDCDDSDCDCTSGPNITTESNCINGLDDDSDGDVDCDDGDCAANPSCQSGPPPTGGVETSCTNGRDDDGDSLIDCDDTADCSTHPTCAPPPEAPGLSCQASFMCFACCPQTDQACQMGCQNAMTTDAMNQMNAINGCLMAFCTEQCTEGTGSDEACSECVAENCQADIDSCGWNVIDGPLGGCFALMTCMQTCPQPLPEGSGSAETCPADEGVLCFDQCLSSTRPEGVDLLIAVNMCIAEDCAEECGEASTQEACSACAQTTCGAALQACAMDR